MPAVMLLGFMAMPGPSSAQTLGSEPSQSGSDPVDPASGSLTGPVSGYMDFHYNNREDEDARLDFHRFVLLFSHNFSDRIRFVSELELEHAVRAGGRLEWAGQAEDLL